MALFTLPSTSGSSTLASSSRHARYCHIQAVPQCRVSFTKAQAPAVRGRSARLICRAESAEDAKKSADSWIAKWKVRKAAAQQASGEEVAPTLMNPWQAKYENAQKNFTYVYCQDMVVESNSVELTYFKDVLQSRGVTLQVPELCPQGQSYTISTALDQLTAALEGKGQVRLMGRRVGALVATLYAAQYPDRVDKLVLLEPAFALLEVEESLFGGAEAVSGWRESGSLQFEDQQISYQLIEDAQNHAAFPYVKSPAYVIHGVKDTQLPIENSLTWVRAASQMMRGGKRLAGQYNQDGIGQGEDIGERRLLEVNAVHGLEGCFQLIQTKLLDYWELRGPEVISPTVNLEGSKPSQFARDHSLHFEEVPIDELLKEFNDKKESKGIDDVE